MDLTIFEYERVFKHAKDEGNKVLTNVKSQVYGMSNDEIDLAPLNYDKVLYRLEGSISDVEKQALRYKYDKMNRAEFALVLQSIAEGTPYTLITVSITHRLRKMDTLHLLSRKYGVEVEEILNHNKMSVEEFEDAVDSNSTIQIPQKANLSKGGLFSGLPVFGSVSGRNAWGLDFGNDIEADEDGDIKVIDNEQTLLQGLSNMFGEEGDIPGYENAQIDLDWGKDLAPELVDFMTIIKIQDRITQDPRITEIKDIQIDTKGVSKLVTIKVVALNNEGIIEKII